MPDKNTERIQYLNEKVAEVAEEQKKELVTDYDEALQEYHKKNQPHKIRFKGKEYDIPASMPFSFSMFYMRNCVVKRNNKTFFEIPEEKMQEFIERMFGKEFWATVEGADDVELDFVLSHLIPDMMAKWGYDIKGEAKTERKNV